MPNETVSELIRRIESVKETDKAKFGKMNVKQMIAHCSDQFRMMFGEVEGLVREDVDINELRQKLVRGETVQTVKELDQVAGEGTKSVDFENDKKILIDYLNRFNITDDSYDFAFHPFYGIIPGANWDKLVVYHLNHHLYQFGR